MALDCPTFHSNSLTHSLTLWAQEIGRTRIESLAAELALLELQPSEQTKPLPLSGEVRLGRAQEVSPARRPLGVAVALRCRCRCSDPRRSLESSRAVPWAINASLTNGGSWIARLDESRIVMEFSSAHMSSSSAMLKNSSNEFKSLGPTGG